MRHRKSYRKHGRRTSARIALMRSLVLGLFMAEPTDTHAERIITTVPKAKDARRMADRLVTLGKKGTLAARRRALEVLPNKRAVRKLFEEIAPRYADRQGGYTRILRLGKNRVGDDASQCLLELVGLSEAGEAAPQKPVVADDVEPATPPATEPAESADDKPQG
jgi:large subunit ribosomal protein L17